MRVPINCAAALALAAIAGSPGPAAAELPDSFWESRCPAPDGDAAFIEGFAGRYVLYNLLPHGGDEADEVAVLGDCGGTRALRVALAGPADVTGLLRAALTSERVYRMTDLRREMRRLGHDAAIGPFDPTSCVCDVAFGSS
jgi:hypothetical protein